MKVISVIVLLLVSSLSVFAQLAKNFSRDTRSYFDYGLQVYANAYQNATASEILVTVNTANALFSFVRTSKELQHHGQYYAIRDISIEIRESRIGNVIGLKTIRDTIYAETFEATTNKQRWHSLAEYIPLKEKKATSSYQAHIEIRDGFLTRLAANPRTVEVSLRSFNPEKSLTARDTTYIGIADPILFDARRDENTFVSSNWGKTYEFSRDMIGGIVLARGISSPTIQNVEVKLYQLQTIFDASPTDAATVASGTVIYPEQFQKGHMISAHSVYNDSVITYQLITATDSIIQYETVMFTLEGKKLERGKYRLDVVVTLSDGLVRTVSRDVELDWHLLPVSLLDPQDALPPMQHIMTDEEYGSLKSGNKYDHLRKLYAYWAMHDPTPETAYNERMAEFYKRCDYAYFNFAKNPRLLDGAMTDRGKIYILFGAPTNIERSFLLGEQPVEIWTYTNNVKKIFQFTDESGRADYKLTDIQPIQ